jgi:hypothetical protein
MVVTMSGCSKNSIRDSVDGFMQSTSGNKPPQFFMFANSKTADNFTLEHKDFSVKAPLAYDKDWNKMLGWRGGFIYGGAFYSLAQYRSKETKGIVLDYTFEFMSSTTTYEERERAVEYKDMQYILTNPTTQYGKDKYDREGNINVHYETHGKENYTCLVSERADKTRGMKGIGFNCYKFNTERTMAKNVVIRLVYTKVPTLPKELEALAQEYTYEDLLKRSQRVLNSLYIKDGWEE